jgi:hypothetical protein
MSAKTLKNEREQLIKQLAEVIANKYSNIFTVYLQLPLLKHELVHLRELSGVKYGIRVKFPRWFEQTILSPDSLGYLWLNNHYTAEQIEDDINHLSKIECELKQSYAEYNETAKIRDLISKYS